MWGKGIYFTWQRKYKNIYKFRKENTRPFKRVGGERKIYILKNQVLQSFWKLGGPERDFFFLIPVSWVRLPRWPSSKESACNAEDLGWEEPLEEGMATHFSILAWKVPWAEELGRATVHGIAKSQTKLTWLRCPHALLSYLRTQTWLIHICRKYQ